MLQERGNSGRCERKDGREQNHTHTQKNMWRYTNEQTKIGYKVKEEEAQILRVKKTSTQRIPRIFLTNLRVVKGFSMHVTPGQLC